MNDFNLTITSYNENPWEQRKLEDLLKVNSGKDYKQLDRGNVPVYGTSGYMLSVNKSLSENDAIGIGRKGTIDKPQFLKAPFWTVDTLFFLTLKHMNDLNFIYYKFQNINWKKYDESTGVPSLTKNTINKIKISIPQLNEQNKIKQLFTFLDNLLALYDRKLKLVKLIYKELENKVYNNDLIKQTNFTKVKLGEILKEKNIKSTYEDQYPVLSSTNSGIELRNGRTNSSSNIGYKVLSKNELVLSPQNLWLGNININFNFENGLVSPSYKVFSLTNNVNIIYLNSLLHHPKMMYLYKVVSVQGASVVRRNLDIEAFKNLTLKLPSIDAQDKIGNLLDKNKQLIDNLENKKEQFSKVKTTLLNTMFI